MFFCGLKMLAMLVGKLDKNSLAQSQTPKLTQFLYIGRAWKSMVKIWSLECIWQVMDLQHAEFLPQRQVHSWPLLAHPVLPWALGSSGPLVSVSATVAVIASGFSCTTHQPENVPCTCMSSPQLGSPRRVKNAQWVPVSLLCPSGGQEKGSG